jgi:hypothetical protein
MITLGNAIDRFKAAMPGSKMSDEVLTANLATLDNDLRLHVRPISVDVINYNFDTDQNTELLLSGTQFEDLYELYLRTIYYRSTNEWLLMDNYANVYNARYRDAQYYYSRSFPPEQSAVLHNYW